MSRFAATSKICAALVVTIMVAVIAVPADAAEQKVTIKGQHARGGKVTFKASKLKGKKVRKLSVRINGRLKTLSKKHRKRVIRKGVLTVKSPPRTEAVFRAPGATPRTEPAPVLVAVVETVTAAKPSSPKPPAFKPISCAAREALAPGRVPGACWRPYGDDSPFNRRINDAPRVHPRSGDYVRQLMRFGGPSLSAGGADTEHDWAHPTYYPTGGDPVFTVHCAEDWGDCAVEGAQVRIPDAARPAAGGDGHMTVVDTESGWEYDFWQVRDKPRGGGTLTISWGGRTRIDGDGLGSSATAAGYGNLAGPIRGPELAAGRIDHALFLVFRCDDEGHVYPAAKGGSHCSRTGVPSADAFPMGTRFQLAMSDAEIDALDVPAWKKTILRAMAQYGMYFGDTGGASWGIQFESGSTYTSFGMEDPIDAIARDAGVRKQSDGVRYMDLAGGVDWTRHLRALEPCTADGSC